MPEIPFIREFEVEIERRFGTRVDVIPDGRIHRFVLDGRDDDCGAYVLFPDAVPGGWAKAHNMGIEFRWRYSGGQIGPGDASYIRERSEERSGEVKRLHEVRSRIATDAWRRALNCRAHPYAARKEFSCSGLKSDMPRVGPFTDLWCLMVPMMDAAGRVWNVQRISPTGDKRVMVDGKTSGLFYRMPGRGDRVRICEGIATAKSVHERTGETTYVAFCCGNLLSVAKAAKEIDSGKRIVVCADNDRFTDGNPGITFGKEAAKAVGGSCVWPEFPPGVAGTDWNDYGLLQKYGPDWDKQ